jgi:hypothetical protein
MRSVGIHASILLCVLVGGCRSGRSGEVRELVPELTMEGVRFSVERGGLTRAWGEAERLTYRRDTTALGADRLTLYMNGADGEVRVTAPRGFGIVADRRFDVEGGIQLTRGADSATTASARYEAPQRGPGLVSGTEPVKVAGPGYRLTGRGFRLDPTTGQIVILGGARLLAGLPVTP